MTAVCGLCQSHKAGYANHPRTRHLTKLAKLISRIYIAVLLGVITISKTFPHALMESWDITQCGLQLPSGK